MTAPAGAAGHASRKETAATTLRPIRVLPIPQHRPPVVMAEELPLGITYAEYRAERDGTTAPVGAIPLPLAGEG